MKLFIGTSAANDIAEKYFVKTKELLDEIVKIEKIDLVFGGYSEGLMRISYETFKNKKRTITAISPSIYESDMLSLKCQNNIVTRDGIERTKEIYNNSDIFLFLPGGTGSLAEFFSIMKEIEETKQSKLIIIYNIDNFYTPLITYLENLLKEKFIKKSIKECCIIVDKKEQIIKCLNEEVK